MTSIDMIPYEILRLEKQGKFLSWSKWRLLIQSVKVNILSKDATFIDLLQYRRVCKQWKVAVDCDVSKLFKCVTPAHIYPKSWPINKQILTLEQAQTLITKFNSHLQYVHLIDLMSPITPSDNKFIDALINVPQLQSLSIRLSAASFNIADFLQFGQLLPEKMRYIEICFRNTKEEFKRGDYYNYTKDPLNGVCYLNDFIPRFSMLEVLFMRAAPYSNLRGVSLSYMPHTLRSLELLNHRFDGLELRHLAENCDNLEFLRVSVSGTVDIAQLKKVCFKLKVFELDLFRTNFVGLEKQSIFAPELEHFLYRHYLSSPMTDDEREFLSKFLTHGIFEHSEKLQSIMLDFREFSHRRLTPAQRQIDFFFTLGNYQNLQALSLENVIIFDDTVRNICVNNADLQLLQLTNTTVTVEGFISSLQQNARPKQLGFRTHHFDYSAYDLHQGLCKYLDEQYDVNERPTGSDDPRILHFGGMFNDSTEKYYDGFANMHPFIMLHWWIKLLPKCAYGFYPDNVNLWKYSSVNIYSWNF